MATPQVRAFHEQKMREARIHASDKIHTDDGKFYRMQHPSYQGLPYNSTGARLHPFFSTPNQNWKPLIPAVEGGAMTGGVLRDDTYRKQLLERRRTDYLDQEAIQEGLPAPAQPRTELTADDTLKIQLYSLIDQVQESLVSNVSDIGNYAEIMRQITFNVIKLANAMSGSDVAELLNILENMGEIVDAKISDRTPSEPLDSVNMGSLLILRNSIVKLSEFLQSIAGFVDRQPADKIARIRTSVQKVFGQQGIKELSKKISERAIPFQEDISDKPKGELIDILINSVPSLSDATEEKLRKDLNKKTVSALRKQIRYGLVRDASDIERRTTDIIQPAEVIPPIQGDLSLFSAESPRQGSGKDMNAEQFLIDLIGAKGKSDGSRKNLKLFAKIVADHCPADVAAKSRTVQKGYLLKMVRAGKVDLAPYMAKKGAGVSSSRIAKVTGAEAEFDRLLEQARRGDYTNIPGEYVAMFKEYVAEEKAAEQRGREIAAQQQAAENAPVPTMTITEIPRARFAPQKVRKEKK